MSVRIGHFVRHVSRGLKSIEDDRFLVAWGNEFVSAISLDDGAAESTSRGNKHVACTAKRGLCSRQLLREHFLNQL